MEDKPKQVYVYTPCTHFQQPIKVGDNTIYATTWLSYLREEENWKSPDLFVALDDVWLGEFADVYSNGVEESLPEPLVPTIYVEWSDQRACPPDVMPWLIDLVAKRLDRGDIVEVSCIGGHGRTGTFLACLIGDIEGLTPNDSILALRERYCKKAVESKSQFEQVYTFLGAQATDVYKDWSFPIPVISKFWKKGDKAEDVVETVYGQDWYYY